MTCPVWSMTALATSEAVLVLRAWECCSLFSCWKPRDNEPRTVVAKKSRREKGIGVLHECGKTAKSIACAGGGWGCSRKAGRRRRPRYVSFAIAVEWEEIDRG